MADSLFDEFKKLSDNSIVYFSCGKDSIVALDLCHNYLNRVSVFFMYLVAGLSFQERYLAYIERKYQLSITRVPHWQLSRMIKYATYMPAPLTQVSLVTPKDMDFYCRKQSGMEWIVSGEKMCDSIPRHAMLKKSGAIDLKRKRFFPLINMNDAGVFNYLKVHGIMLPPDYGMFRGSFGRLWAPELGAIKSKFPNDYKKILEVFPYAEAAIKREEFKSVSKV